jgi:hypothetical protein
VSATAGRGLRMFVSVGLVTAAALFAVGVVRERRIEAKEHPSAESSEPHSEAGEHASRHVTTEPSERVLGVRTDGPGTTIVAVIASFALAAAVWWQPRRGVFLVTAGVALAFAVFDAGELVHQADAHRGGLAAVAATVAAVHLLVAVAAFVLAAERTARPVTLPA